MPGHIPSTLDTSKGVKTPYKKARTCGLRVEYLVAIERDGDAAVPDHFLHHFGVDRLFQKERRARTCRMSLARHIVMMSTERGYYNAACCSAPWIAHW